MAGAVTGAGEVGDFVLAVAALAKQVYGQVVHVGLAVVAGRLKPPVGHHGRHRCALLVGKVVGRYVVHTHVDQTLKVTAPLGHGLFGDGEDKVAGKVIEAGLARCRQSRTGVGGVVQAAQGF